MVLDQMPIRVRLRLAGPCTHQSKIETRTRQKRPAHAQRGQNELIERALLERYDHTNGATALCPQSSRHIVGAITRARGLTLDAPISRSSHIRIAGQGT